MLYLFPSRTIFLTAGPVVITWYGVLYIVAFLVAWVLLPRLQKYRDLELSKEDWLYVLTLGVAGVLLGGRLGYVLFYEPIYFFNNPGQIFAIWQGGMASHGGFIGVGLALWWAARQLKISWWALLDVAMVPGAIGLALGRVANFINQELYISAAAHWGVIAKDLLIALVVWHFLRRRPSLKSGQVTALLLILYAILRFVSEYWRVSEFDIVLGLTRGQMYTIPLLLLGLWLWRRSDERKITENISR